jgi:hypothetical protein
LADTAAELAASLVGDDKSAIAAMTLAVRLSQPGISYARARGSALAILDMDEVRHPVETGALS